MIRSILFLLLLSCVADAQTISIYAPPMKVAKVRPGHWLTAREPCTVAIEGHKPFTAWIDETEVTGILRRSVSPCLLYGVGDDCTLHLELPREPVVFGTAQAMRSAGWFTTADGVSHPAVVDWPACRSRRIGNGLREAEAIQAEGFWK